MIGLAVMRLQPLHRGHRLLIETMLEQCDRAIVGIGSVQERGTERNPYSFDLRKAMIRVLFPDEKRLQIIGLEDIGAPTKKAWALYVLARIAEEGLEKPDRYFGGSAEDTAWFEETMPVQVVDRHGIGEGINATAIRRKLKEGEPLEGEIPEAVEKLLRSENGAEPLD